MTTEDVRNGGRSNMNVDHSKTRQMGLRKFKMLLILPLAMLPFVTLAFWSLGGGNGADGNNKIVGLKEGLNLDLPSANIKDDGKDDKLTFYEKADQEEEKSEESLKNDPFYELPGSGLDSNKLDEIVAGGPTIYDPTQKNPYSGLNTSPVHSEKYKDATEEKIMNRLQQLQHEINKPQMNSLNNDEMLIEENGNTDVSGDVDRLEGMMRMLQEKKENDPEMQNFEGMLDKILDIQHPERVKDRMKEKSMQHKQTGFTVFRKKSDANNSLLSADTNIREKATRNGFYGLNDGGTNDDTQNAVEAVVHQTQTLVNGSIVKLRLLNDIYIHGTLIPKENFLFGIASLEGERLKIEINSVRFSNSIFPVKLNVYDLDGLDGINIPGAITRDVAKQSADNGLQNIEMTTLNTSVAAQATAAGINTAKSLLSKKVKLVKVTVKAGYKVLLWNQSNEQ